MQKLLIYGDSVELTYEIKQYLEKRLPYKNLVAFTKEEAKETLANRSMQLFMMECDVLSNQAFNVLKEIRYMGFSYPILVLANSVEAPEFDRNQDRSKIFLLEKPFEYKALAGITKKLMMARHVHKQKYRRFQTQQQAVVETFLTGELCESNMFNLSIGGTYCEFHGPDKLPFSIGDMLRVKVPLAETSREYVMNAKVVWTTRRGHYSGLPGAGMRFVKTDDVYRQLIEKV